MSTKPRTPAKASRRRVGPIAAGITAAAIALGGGAIGVSSAAVDPAKPASTTTSTDATKYDVQLPPLPPAVAAEVNAALAKALPVIIKVAGQLGIAV